MIQNVVTIFQIVASDKDAQLEFSGRYDADGDPVLIKPTYSIEPGSLWTMDDDDPDFAHFLEIGAVRLATPMEVQLGRPADA